MKYLEEKNMDEISLRELIEILYKHKRMITAIVVISLLISFLYCFLIAEPIYQAKAEIDITEIRTGANEFDKANDPKNNTDNYIKWIQDPKFIDAVSKKLESKNINIDNDILRRVMFATKGKDGVSISLIAKYKEKKYVSQIANTIAEVLDKQASVYLAEQLQQQIAIIEERIKLVLADSEQALEKYKTHLSNPDSLEKLQSELDVNKSVLAQLKTNLISGNIGSGKDKKQLEHDITTLEEKLNMLHEKLADANYMDRTLKREIDSLLTIYESHGIEYDSLKLAEEYYKNRSNIKIVSYAVEPMDSVGPRKMMIIAIAAVMGLMIGAFIAFFIEYWKYTAPQKL
jgi:capsular polysaccharide biosynthesis protein